MWCFGICLGICFGICVGDVSICIYVYGCKYQHELCYKAPISGMGVMSLCFHVGLLLSKLVIVNIALS